VLVLGHFDEHWRWGLLKVEFQESERRTVFARPNSYDVH
jgi:hypothetical protein